MRKNKIRLLPDEVLRYLLNAYLLFKSTNKKSFNIYIHPENKLMSFIEYLESLQIYGTFFEIIPEKHHFTIKFTPENNNSLFSFIKNYNALYSKKTLDGQENYAIPQIYSDKLLNIINKQNFIELNGYKNILIQKNTNPLFFHSLMYLHFLKQIRLNKIIYKQSSIGVKLDNFTKGGKLQTVTTQWPGNFRWEGNTFVFGDYGKISFTEGKRKALFLLLETAKGEWVLNKKLSAVDEKAFRVILGQVKKRIKAAGIKNIDIISSRDSGIKPLKGGYKITILS